MSDGGLISESRRDSYPLRATDVFAVVAFWALLALISAAGRELDPPISSPDWGSQENPPLRRHILSNSCEPM